MPHRYKNIARVVRLHGKKGEVLVAPLRGLPLLLAPGMRVALTPPALKRERFSTVEALTETSDGARVRFSCAHDLDEAERIAGCYVLACVDDLDLGPLDASADELLGRTVIDERYGELGRLSEVRETPANNVWVVSGEAHGEVLLPVIEDVVPAIPETGPIAVRVMDGLIDA